jgi:hypothetical protein
VAEVVPAHERLELADTHLTDLTVGSFSDFLLQYAIRF